MRDVAVIVVLENIVRYVERLARNTVFDPAGNIFIAAMIGLAGWLVAQRAIFYLFPGFALLPL